MHKAGKQEWEQNTLKFYSSIIIHDILSITQKTSSKFGHLRNLADQLFHLLHDAVRVDTLVGILLPEATAALFMGA